MAWLGAVWRNLRDKFPLTWLGLLVGVCSAAALKWVALVQLDLVVLIVAYTGLGLLLVCVLMVLGVSGLGAWLWRVPELQPIELQTQHFGETGYTLPALRLLPLIRLRVQWAAPQRVRVQLQRRGGRMLEQALPLQRGEFSGIARYIDVHDVLGLCSVRLKQAQPTPVTVLPSMGALHQLSIPQSFAGGDVSGHPWGSPEGDRMDLRRYAPGDPARFIHWKLYARTRKALVRHPERALAETQRLVAYMIAGEHDDASAGAARLALQTGALGHDWCFGADGTALACTRLNDALHALLRSAHQDPKQQAMSNPMYNQGRGLERFLKQADQQGPGRLLVFAPAATGPWVEVVKRVSAGRLGHTQVVVGLDVGSRMLKPKGVWSQLMFAPSSTDAIDVRPLLDIQQQLARSCQVYFVDRLSGKLLTLKDLALKPMGPQKSTPQASSLTSLRETQA